MGRFAHISTLVALTVSSVVAQSSIPTCGNGVQCPDSAPCCSQYGQCGVGAYCLGGCDPINSFDLKSCVPAPTCQSGNFKLDSLSDVQSNEVYLGDAANGVNWVSSGNPVIYTDDDGSKSILLTMPADSVGTLLSSSHYVWYGKISVTMRTSAGQGVVTAFVMMSDVKDEIDFEFVGADLQDAQSNFYWQGVPDYNNEKNLSAANTNTETHVYTIDWTPESLTWSIDGNAMRTVDKSDTLNSTDNTYHYPQTPSKIQLSLWPAGKAGNAPGTIAWSGGPIDWQSPYMSNGYYYAQVIEVDVECYQPPSDAQVSGDKSYSYTNTDGLESSVAITDQSVRLASLYASGDNPNYNPDAASKPSGTASTASSTATASAVPSDVQTVPGINNPGGGGVRGDNPPASSGGGGGGGSSGGSSGGGAGGFQQFGDGQTGAAGGGNGEKAMHGSVIAILIAFFGCMLM